MVDFYVVQTETGERKLLPLFDVDEASYEAGKADGIKEAGGCTEDHDVIRQEGYDAAEAVCAAKHFVTTVKGNGGTSISISNVPFKPDVVTVVCMDMEGAVGTSYTPTSEEDYLLNILTVTMDLHQYDGSVLCTAFTVGPKYAAVQASEVVKYDEDTSELTIGDMIYSSRYDATFAENTDYMVACTKYVEEAADETA